MPRLRRHPLILVALVILAGCGDARPAPTTTPGAAAAAPTATRSVPTIAPIVSAATQEAPGAPERSATPAIPTPTTTLTPTFATYRDPRGVFVIDVPSNWQTRPLRDGDGLTSLAYNATAIFSISFSWQAERLSPTVMAQLVEDVKTRTFSSYLTKNVKLTGTNEGEAGYVLAGTATLTGTPTTIEISLRQTAGGTVVLQSWLVPTELWATFLPLFKEPMEASLTTDDAAAESLTQQ